jgi:hypothetical protein
LPPGESVALQLPLAAVSVVRAHVLGEPPANQPLALSKPSASSES